MWKQYRDTHYEVSEDGQVRSTLKKRTMSIIHQNGYCYVDIRLNKRCKRSLVHRMVAECYLENPNVLPLVNHKNGDKHNNHYLNLEWITHRQNTLHALATGLTKNPRKLTMTQADEVRELRADGSKYRELAEAYNLSIPAIHLICTNQTYMVGIGGN